MTTTRTCNTCIHHKAPELHTSLGSCEYPVPRYLNTSISNYVIGHEAQDCLTYAEAAYSNEEKTGPYAGEI